ncbi:F0F1 ATP synthase subunit delta [Lottiidibacillus patelloidae]|uniref:ATP synthase subunit delta n=1 Tax=Lottiidibacillus patelloidae TaxID=2670334 RepID=A0A263BUE5_9BACI|nr:F0F1 ATP synthase subunit delta [Lottiidibacillus patelloidae]OZM56796.1 F0F1 ATP synthase subunit delta [Lottiidibacillus patelloidae]
MSKNAVSNRYAVALFELATEKGKLDQLEQELRAFKDVYSQNKNFQQFLKYPKISVAKKKELLKEAFGELSAEALNTLYVIVDRNREEIIIDMIEEFFALANEKRGIAEATIYSVKELSADEEKALSEVFAKRVGKQTLNITNVIDKELIGGIKVQIGNRIFDGSVSNKLKKIQRQLVSAQG